MKKSFSTMGMPATVMITDPVAREADVNEIFSYFHYIDKIFSTYKPTSEVSRINSGKLPKEQSSKEVQEVLNLCEKARLKTQGYFSIERNGKIDPSGMVKGYAIYQAAKKLQGKEYKNFYVEIAGDIQVAGRNEKGEKWRIGIENPFNAKEIIKILSLSNCGIATSGNYKQGQHIYNPMTKSPANEIMSMTVIAGNVEEADMLATAAFAMGEKGISFLEHATGIEGYMIKKDETAVYTSGFEKYVIEGFKI